ncbi:inositol monophosphatase family protein [Janibacter alkaliphilus]|uniref:inositol-phosphate phosphatase n=1 Tax=Janibacter alkaliphilus TaxID=1069963 RepID=A0A852XH93_9MICO|nr:myo-inositol-1(or 4)-monophosphatase [Janibacter alkaliphilus]
MRPDPAALPVPADELPALADLALELAEEAGELVRDERPVELGVAATKSSATDVVTVMDQRSQDLLLRRVGQHRPEDAFHGEESGGRSGSSGLTWVVDPIDGTVNYLYGIAAYAVSVAVVVGDPAVPGGWHPVAGAVVNPVSEERYQAALGHGATRAVGSDAPAPLDVGAGPDAGLPVALLGTGFGYEAGRRAWQGQVAARMLPRVRDIRRLGSAALDLCRVADGSLDAYYERGLNPWDLAAGWLVATEAGARVTDLSGGDPRTAMTVAGPPRLHEELLGALTEVLAEVGEEPAEGR